ncbi:unnamed protein product, partial [Mesorhabditis belari]|uniref:tRNA (uracil-O(2)-)-methyltransferase n=1 Tax=Mesorhabditis belari TaxID=2138241 RepID=A0AAF3E9Z7_9BILA
MMKVLCVDKVGYEEENPLEECFKKLIYLWSTQCHTVNRRIIAITELSPDQSADFDSIVASCLKETQLPENVEEKYLHKLIPRTPIFSICYQMHFFTDVFHCHFYTFAPNSDLKNPHLNAPYAIRFRQIDEKSGELSVEVDSKCSEHQEKWICDHVFPTLIRWMKTMKLDQQKVITNRLIDSEKYAYTYLKIKEDFGKPLVLEWKESTDPQKFVFEDCGISAYLMEIWKSIDRFPKKFADIGCGNGLLVHLLNKLGVDGIGIDLRKRKIWQDLFNGTKLIEGVVDPTRPNDPNLEAVDFLIGNHSDELTPWIPIMAARLGCDFFLLPCCPFDFKGKFCHKRPNQSKYDAFLQFVRKICEELGYETRDDRLSIPSTKRKCFVCTIPSQGLKPNLDEVIARLTAGHSTTLFLPREKEEKVLNCSRVPVEVRERITKRIFTALLGETLERKSGEWREGNPLSIASVFSLLPPEEVDYMRQQNGGLQTFIKNQHQIFRIESGNVRIRDWRKQEEWNGMKKKKAKMNPSKIKTTACWMHLYHPDGCPLTEEECTYLHSS